MPARSSSPYRGPGERTPLLAVVQSPPPPARRPARRPNTCARFCTIVAQVTIFYALLYLLIILPLQLVPRRHHSPPWRDMQPPHSRYPRPRNQSLDLPHLIHMLSDTADINSTREWSRYYSSGAHVASKNFSQALHTRDTWESFGIPSDIVEYEVLLTYPGKWYLPHRGNDTAALSLAVENGTRKDYSENAPGRVLFRASLEEDELPEDEYSRLEGRPRTFHGYGAQGNVTGPYVYAGYCDQEAFKQLEKLDVPIKGHIVVCRYGLIFRGLKVKGAQDRGAIGVVMFTDPADDYPDGWSGGGAGNGKPYPKGSGRQPSSVQRGSVQFTSLQPGDPTTPGYASKPGVDRHWEKFAIPSIPSLPISYVDAIPILKALNGWGTRVKSWRKGGLKDEGVEYWTGPIGHKPDKHDMVAKAEEAVATTTKPAPPETTVLNLYVNMDQGLWPIWDVIGVINGSISDEVVVIGNHRDAWCAGAADPVSGTAAMMELAKTLGAMLKQGWKPLRTIILASWDAEEYGMVGSTEWVEDNRAYLMQKAVAYLNLDVGVSGPWLDTAAAPLMYNVLTTAMKGVKDPMADKKRKLIHKGESVRTLSEIKAPPTGMDADTNGMATVKTHRGRHHEADKHKGSVYELWSKDDGVIRPVGSGSDFVGFQDIALVPVADFSFRQGFSGAVYHYHSNYDSFDWMKRFGDPDFLYHNVATNLLGHMALQLVESPVIPFHIADYADFLVEHVSSAIAFFDNAVDGLHGHDNKAATKDARTSLIQLYDHTTQLKHAAMQFDSRATALAKEIAELPADAPWWKRWFWSVHYWARVKEMNSRIMFFERKFVYEQGLDGREVYKHVVFAPGLWTGYSGAVFPGILEGIEASNFTAVERWAGIIEECVDNAKDSILWNKR
ncbi:hypothetical protein Dda_2537 [Drechslerella dactyloides]|uniref:Uncharacterized protein n=1 Tax=Drechslerella dactyloides TaxID=74499 RepID=A0AAD6IZP8_DREDA|nr:hypothetical protein Dda_2537 [Drechslerella dactyloides]